MKKNVKKIRSSRGFTLVEVIISIAILVMVIFASTSLLVSIIRSNANNMNTLIAYGLAQEGLEGVRNMRDSDWLLNANFQADLPDGSKPFVADFPKNSGDVRYYTLDYQSFETSDLDVDAGGLADVAPWKLNEVTKGGAVDADYATSTDTLLDKVKSTSPDEVQYRVGGGEPSIYHRYLVLEPIEHQLAEGTSLGYEKKLRVTSVVAWNDGRSHEVRLNTEITDWKP